jgi:hypothetical protein
MLKVRGLFNGFHLDQAELTYTVSNGRGTTAGNS